MVDKQLRNGRACVSGTLFGSESKLTEGEMGEIERAAILEEGLEAKDFIVPNMSQCCSKGSRRELIARYSDLKVENEGDTATFCFTLDKGCYATCLLREFMKQDEILDY